MYFLFPLAPLTSQDSRGFQTQYLGGARTPSIRIHTYKKIYYISKTKDDAKNSISIWTE